MNNNDVSLSDQSAAFGTNDHDILFICLSSWKTAVLRFSGLLR